MKASGVSGGCVESRRRRKKHRIDDDGEGRKKYLELFPNEMGIRVVEQLLAFSAESRDNAKEVEQSNFWLGWVYAWVSTVVKCLTKRETQSGQRQKSCAHT